MEARLIQEIEKHRKELIFENLSLRAELARERERHHKAIEKLEELGLPTRERDELWSAWQYRVKLHRDAIALLAPAPVATPMEGK